MFLFIKDIKFIIFLMVALTVGATFVLKYNSGSSAYIAAKANGKIDIVVDPGHGEFDPGAIGIGNVYEKDINLAVALKLRDALIKAGYKVGMTRTTDKACGQGLDYDNRNKKRTDTRWRTNYINASGASLLISIHMNKFPQSQYKGAQIFYSENAKSESIELAKKVQEGFKTDLGSTREAKSLGKSVFIMEQTKIPALLVECAFLSNWDDLTRIQQPWYQDKLIASIVNGVSSFVTPQ